MGQGLKLRGESRRTRRKICSADTCQPTNHTRTRLESNGVFLLTRQQLTAWAMAWPNYF